MVDSHHRPLRCCQAVYGGDDDVKYAPGSGVGLFVVRADPSSVPVVTPLHRRPGHRPILPQWVQVLQYLL